MLHIISKSPFNNPALSECLRVCDADAVIILIEDGVYAALAGAPWIDQMNDRAQKIYVLSADIDARGLNGRVPTIVETIDYAGFVELCCQHTPIQSWY